MKRLLIVFCLTMNCSSRKTFKMNHHLVLEKFFSFQCESSTPLGTITSTMARLQKMASDPSNFTKPRKPPMVFKCCTITVAVLAGTFLLFYIFLYDIIEMGIRSQFKIEEGNDIYKQWTKVPIPVNYKYHFFEVLNPNEAVQGAKIKLLERGPYCFK